MIGMLIGLAITSLICLVTGVSWYWLIFGGLGGMFIEVVSRFSQGQETAAAVDSVADVGIAIAAIGEVAGEVASGAVDVAGGAVEVAGSVVGGAFEAVGEIVSSIDIS